MNVICRDVNLDYAVCHYDFNYSIPDRIMEAYPGRVEIRPHPPTPKEMKAGWKPTIWKYYRNIKGKGTVIDRIEMDKDRNGAKDYWERYEDGVLKEVSWANPGDTDEKPKHWIEAPEAGQDQGYRGRDEPKKARPAPRKEARARPSKGSK